MAVWGLTFKARTDDLRDSPALAVIQRLLDRGRRVQAYDPTVRSLDGIDVRRDPYAACEGAAVLAVLTEWDELRWLDFDKVAAVMAAPRVVDTRNLLDRASLLRSGFTYRRRGPHLMARWWWPAAPASSAATCASPWWTAATRSSPSTTSSPAGPTTWPACSATSGSRSSNTTSASRSNGRRAGAAWIP